MPEGKGENEYGHLRKEKGINCFLFFLG